MRPGDIAATVTGAALVALGILVVAVGAGAPGLTTEHFGRISCRSSQTDEGRTVWRCTGESPAQRRANEAAAERAREAAPYAHVRPVLPEEPRRRTDLLFPPVTDAVGPRRMTATRDPLTGRWIAHSAPVVGTGLGVAAAGAGLCVGPLLRRRNHRAGFPGAV
jgi:hypothetical protein